ncbi:hypothetical protein [Pseudoxanthomonas sp. PXM02]|nr:hypothetical protein [Pseudoxanthomonas sp. PXM02]
MAEFLALLAHPSLVLLNLFFVLALFMVGAMALERFFPRRKKAF